MHLRLWNFSSAIQSRGNFRGQSRAGPESACPEDLLAQNICLPRGTHPGPGCSEAPSSHLHPWCPTAAACTPRIIERSRCVEKLNKSTSPRRGWTNAYADCICLPRGEYAAPGCPGPPPPLSLSLSLSPSPPPRPPFTPSLFFFPLSLSLALSFALSPSCPPLSEEDQDRVDRWLSLLAIPRARVVVRTFVAHTHAMDREYERALARGQFFDV
jgi:hypothetical protein